MKKLLAMTLIIGLIAGCKKKDPTPQQNNPPQVQQSCFADPNLDGTWISDSIREIWYDSSGVKIKDYTSLYSPPSDYLKWSFFCYSGYPAIFYQSYSGGVVLDTGDSSVVFFNKNTFYDPDFPKDTLEDKLAIYFLSSNRLTLKESVNYTTGDKEYSYTYFRK